MSKDDHQKKDALDELTYCEDANANMSRMDCLPAEDSHGAALRKSVLTGLAKTSCTVNPLEAWAATDAMNYNQRAPRKKYDWEAIATKLGASSTQNDEKMAQTIASKQAELKPTIKDDKFNVDGKLGPKTISILDLHEETSGHINKKKEDKKAETGTKEIAKTITDPQKEQLIKSADPTSQQEAKSNSSQIESQSTPVLQGNEFLIKALETIGLEQDALQPEGANKAFRKIVSEFSGTGDQIAKLIVLAKVHKNPSYTYPIFTGLKYIGKSINIDKKDRKQKPEDHDTTDGICRNLCAHSVSVYNAVLSGSVPSTEDLQTDYNDLRKPNIGLVCNTVTEMMCRIALSNTVPGVKPDDDTGTIDFVNGHSEHGYKNPSPEAQSKLQETDLNKANIGDVIVYYDKSEFTKNGNYKFKHAAIIIDYIEDKNGVRSYAFMGASTLHDASGKNVGGVAPRTTKGGTKDPTSPKGWGFIQTQEDLNNIYTDKIKLVYTSSEKFKAGSVRAGDPYVECITFVWPTGSGKTTQHTQAQQKSEHDDTTQFLASESNETKEKPSIHTPNVEQNVTEPRKDITSLESQPHTTELKQTSDSQKTNDVKTTHKKDTSKPTNKKISNKKDNSTTTKTSSKKSDSKIIPLDESLMIDKKTPDLKNDDEISIELTDTEIENAIKKNKQLISKYKGDPKFEQSRILQAVGSSSSVFDKTSILAIANWQAKRNLPPNGIYDDECRKIDFILTVYETAANNTDINILFVVSQLSYESGWKFSKINNYGGIKAPTENGRGLKPLDPKHASLDWTHENWTDETYKIKQKDYESDPNRSPNPKSGKKITPQGKSKHGKTKYKVQEYFRIFDSLTDFIQNHRSNIVTNVTKKVTKMKDSGKDIYVSDTSQQEAKIREIIQDADFVLRTIQSGKSWHYATSEDYVKHISDRMNIVENMLKEYKLTPARIQNETIQDKSAE